MVAEEHPAVAEARKAVVIVKSIQASALAFSAALERTADALEGEDEHAARHLRAAARMIEGIDADRGTISYLKALGWTLEQAAIEIEDATGGEDRCTKQRGDP